MAAGDPEERPENPGQADGTAPRKSVPLSRRRSASKTAPVAASSPRRLTSQSAAVGSPSEEANSLPEAASVPEEPPSGSLQDAIQAAVQLGWTMATLYCPPDRERPLVTGLLSVHQLGIDDRVRLELDRLASLLERVNETAPDTNRRLPSDTSSLVDAWRRREDAARDGNAGASLAGFRRELDSFNLRVLEVLACIGNCLDVAYEVGRLLRDTSHPAIATSAGEPVSTRQALGEALGRGRVATIQRWLRMLAPNLPSDSAAVVATSVGKWSDFYRTAFGKAGGGRLRRFADGDDFADQMADFLVPQGNLWLGLLSGAESTAGLLSPEGTVRAAVAALSRARRIITKVVWHLLPFLVVVFAALAGIVYLAQADLGGAGRVWTEIGAIVGSLGVSARGIGQTVGRLAREGATPLFKLEEVSAKAWAITTLPAAELTTRGVMALRRSGISAPARLGRS